MNGGTANMQVANSSYGGTTPRPPPIRTYSSSSSVNMRTSKPYGKAAKQQDIMYEIPSISPDKRKDEDTINGGGSARGVRIPIAPIGRRTVLDSPLKSPIDGRSNRERGNGILPRPSSRDALRSPPPPLPSRRGSGSPMESGREGSILSGRSSTYTKRGGDRVTSPNPADIAQFSHHCQILYFTANPPEASSEYISSTLASLPPSHRATYTRIQASFRAQSHDRATRLRLIEFHALISSTFANASLSLPARQDLNGRQAREERGNKLARFVQQWCLKSGVGVEPFFKALYTALRLQSKGERSIGGPGAKRIVWEMDDAVFMEAGGREFMHEAVTMLKGVLGFEDVPLTEPPKIKPIVHPTVTRPVQKYPSMEMLISLDGMETPIPATPGPDPASSPVSLMSSANGLTGRLGPVSRTRSTSDPFIDPRNSPTKPLTPNGSGAGHSTESAAKKQRGPAPPVPAHRPGRSISGKGPPQPPDHKRLSANGVDRLSPPILKLRPANRSLSATSDTSNPLSPGLNEPLLAADTAESVVAALEEAAEEADTLAGLSTQYERQYGNRARSQSNRSIPEDLQSLIVKQQATGADNRDDEDDDDDFTKPRLRLWTLPGHLTDPELNALVALFPTFITKGIQKLRFPLPRPANIAAAPREPAYSDAEAGQIGRRLGESEWPVTSGIKIPPEDAEGFIFPGTGRMWVGDALREEGYRGSFWARLGRWFQRLFGG